MQGEIERRGIATASISLLPEITAKVRPPRALSVPWPLGFPLGRPGDAGLQTAVLRALLALTERRDVPVLAELPAAALFTGPLFSPDRSSLD